MSFPFRTQADMNDAWNMQILNGANAKALAAIAYHNRQQAFRPEGERERGGITPTPRDHEQEPYSTIMNSGALVNYDSGVYDEALSSGDSVATVHVVVSKLIEGEEITDQDDQDALIQLSKMTLDNFARTYPSEYGRLVGAGVIGEPTEGPGGGWQGGTPPPGTASGGGDWSSAMQQASWSDIPGITPETPEPGGGSTWGGEAGDWRGTPPEPGAEEGGGDWRSAMSQASWAQIPGIATDRPTGPLLVDALNKDQVAAGTWTVLDQVAALGAPVMSYEKWRVQFSKPKDTRQSKAEYQFYLLEQTHNVNANKNVDNPDDLVYFSWDPNKPDIAPTPLTGEDDIKAADETTYQVMLDMINEEGFVKPVVGQTGQFASATFSASEMGQAMTEETGKAMERAGISVPAQSLVWTMSHGTLQQIPNLAMAEGQELFGGHDLNQITNDEMITMLKRLDREQGLPESVKKLLNQFEAVPSDTRRSVIGIQIQELATTNQAANDALTRDVTEFMEPADYTFDVDVAEGWTNPGGWRPADGNAATYQTVRAGLRRETFDWDYAPGAVPEGRMMKPEIPGYQASVPYETGTTVNQMIANAGGDADLWGSTEIMEQVFQQAANRDIPMGVAFALLHQKTAGFTMSVDPTTAANIVTDTLNQLSTSMLKFGNPALAVIDQLFPDTAATLSTVGWLDQNHAAVVGGSYDAFLELAKAFPGGFGAESMYFDMAASMLHLNAGTSQEMVTVNHEDPLRVKDALRDAFESLLMPVDDAMLDSFAKQFASAETAAHQPLTNAYNRITSESREMWTSQNQAVTPNVGAYSWLFPVAGQNTYGNDFGGDRSGHQHGGIDIMANMGTPIIAPVSGKIVSVGTAGPNGTGNAGGNRIHLLGDDGILYYFAHNAYNAVTTGQMIGAGETIGLVGNTGNAWKGGSGAPHLHFEMHANGRFNSQNYNPGEGDGRVNPFNYLRAAEAEGATVISPFDTTKWQGQTIEDAARAAAYAGTVSITLPDLVARARQQARDTPLYQDLFGEKPVGLSDVDYASAFAGTAATLAGTPAPEAARIGAATGSMDALYGSLLADSDIADTSTTFRGRLFEMSNAFTDAMSGRP